MRPRPDFGAESYRGSGKLEGRAAIVSGGDSGIGRAVALAFAREGADVTIAYLEEDEDANVSAKAVEESGRRAVPMRGDLGDAGWCADVVERTVEEFGRLDVLVNNAGFQAAHDRIEDFTVDEVERIFRSNVLSTFLLTRAAVAHMEPGAAVINTASIQAFDPSPALMPYAASKAAVANLTKGMARGLIERGIRVNAVAPGPVWTPLIAMSFDEEKIRRFGESNPTGRPAQPAEIAPAYVFLASDESRFVVGEVIGVTGGELLPS